MFKRFKIRTRLLIGFLLMVIPLLAISRISLFGLDSISRSFNEDISRSTEELQKGSQLDSVAQFIRYYDEVLTQSARNYAFTGDIKWKQRYEENAPKLDKKIKEALAIGDQTDSEFFSSVDNANIALVKMEEEAMALVEQGLKEDAVKILEDDEYWKQKEIYKNGLVSYVEKRGKAYDEALETSAGSLRSAAAESQYIIDFSKKMTIFLLIISLVLSMVLAALAAYSIAKPIRFLRDVAREISKGNLDKKIEIRSKDEIGELAATFNEMTQNLKESRENIEKKVMERTDELEKLNSFMVGRELKMMDLKKEIEKLKNNK